MSLRSRPTAAGCVAVLVLTGCSALGSDDGAQDAATRLAAALTDGDTASVPRTGDVRGAEAAERTTTALGGLADQPRRVRASEVETDGDAATVRLGWRWQVAGRPWSYRTTARLERSDDTWRWAEDSDDLHPDLAAGARLVLDRTPATRGRILGAGGAVVVTDRPVARLGLDKTLVPAARAARSAGELARVLDLDPARFTARVRAAGPREFVEGVVLRAETFTPALRARALAVPGAAVLRATRPLAPTRTFAAALLGTVGPATAELVQESDGRVAAGDLTGLSGLQRRYDEQLAGTAGATVRVAPAEGGDDAADEDAAPLLEVPARAGRDLTLTLDPADQRAAEAALSGTRGAAAVVVLDNTTGGVLATATGPGTADDVGDTGRYAPGSTFKVVSALALMRRGLRPQDRVACTDTVTVDGRRFENYDDYPASATGRITLTQAVANSCNTAIIGERGRLREGDLAAAAASLGLGQDRDVGFASFFGQVPAPGSETERAASMIGQGRVLASPLAMALVAASVQSGRTTVPRLVGGVDVPAARDSLTDVEAQRLRTLMRAVVTDGSGRFLSGAVPGAPVGAKTGTAEYGETSPPRTHAWMIANAGRRSVAVFVEDGESGSATAGPVLERYLRAVG